jgi:non-ribosomal peptide synthase protein (TIGR01720 family)
LRVIFKNQDNRIVQDCLEMVACSVEIFEISEQAFENQANSLQASLKIEKSPLMKIAIFRTSVQDFLFITIHHLLIDAVSWRILLEDFVMTYTSVLTGQKYTLLSKTDSYKRWTEQLNEYANSVQIQQEALYWKPFEKMLMQSIPYDLATNQTKVSDRKTFEIELDTHYTDLLLTRSHQAFNTDINDILLTALSEATNQQFGVKDLVVMLESHGRTEMFENISLDRTIGWFTSEYPVCISTQKNPDLAMKIKTTKENLHKVPNLGIGYNLLKYCSDTGSQGDLAKPQIVFNYIGQVDQDGVGQGFKLLETTLGNEESLENQSDYPLEILSNVSDGKLKISVQFHQTQFYDFTISSWMQKYKEALQRTIDFCIERDVQEMTPSDYDYQGLSMDELADLNAMF